MDWFQAVILALVQGLTEFLPISSSAHLILPSRLLGWPDQGLAFDVAVHVGSLAAVVIYFRRELAEIFQGGVQSLGGKWTPSGKLAWLIVLGTLPALLTGFFLEDVISEHLRSTKVIAYATLIGAIALGAADRWNAQRLDISHMTILLALLIGVAQACAMVPGTSRSGATITMALLLGFNRVAAARFSFLLSVPIILAGGIWQGMALLQQGSAPWGLIGLATLVSGVSAYLCIHYFLKFISMIGMLPFVIYRLILGVFLLTFVA